MDLSYEESAKAIYKGLFLSKTKNEKEQKILEIIKLNVHEKRLYIREKYEELFPKETNLIEDFRQQLSGNFSQLVQYLFMPPLDFDCLSIHNGLEKIFFDEKCIFEIITIRPHDYLQNLKYRFYQLYKKDLEKIFIEKFGEDIGKCLNILMKERREKNSGNPDYSSAEKKVQILLENEPKSWVKNINIFTTVFAKTSAQELIVIGRIFYEKTKKDFPVEINKKLSSLSSRFLTEVVYNTCHPSELFASKIYNSILGFGFFSNNIDRIVVSRNEIDMKVIRILYKYIFGSELVKDILGNSSGAYEQLLAFLCSKE